jgi:ribulose 1,5-bisphosphate synthetase/thiazole synthase
VGGIQLIEKADVIIAGGGPSGTVAAIAAARNGLKVLLVDKNSFLGGMNTAAMVCPIMSFHAGNRQIIKGIPQEVIDRLKKRGGSIGHVHDPLGVVSTITPIEPELLKQVYFEMVRECPLINLLLHTFVSGASVENGVIKGISCTNKSGTKTYQAKFFIDATGDGDLASICKAEYEEGRVDDGFAQPMTLMFKMGGVDLEKIKEYIKEKPEQFVLDDGVDIDKYLAVSGFFNLVDDARKNGEFNIQRDRVLLFEGINRGEVFVNMSRITKLKGTDAGDLTRAEMVGHAQIDEIISFLRKYIPGFSCSYLIATGSYVGVRETRRIKGRYSLSAEDVTEGRSFDDSIATCSFPIDIHDPLGDNLKWIKKNKNTFYDIPFRVMLPRKLKNLIVTGRCISASHEALASARISATAMALGQAAGTAAAVACRHNILFPDIDVSEIQKSLQEQGAVVGKAWVD